MKINIKNAAPILQRKSDLPRNQLEFMVAGWEVQGSYLINGETCMCKSRTFDLNIRLEKMKTSHSELAELVKKQLGDEK